MSDLAEPAVLHTDPAADPMHATGDTATIAAGPQTEEERANAALDAHDVIKTHVIAAMTVGLVPLPGVDMAGTIAVQVRMVSKICEIYGIAIREKAARTAVLSLAGGVLPAVLGGTLVSGLKIIPGFGSIAGAAGASILGGAVTYAIGTVFQQHLATHDSLIDLDVEKMKAAVRTEFEAGLKVARSLRARVAGAIVPNNKAAAATPDAAVVAPEPAAEHPAAEHPAAEATVAEATPEPAVEAAATDAKETEGRKPSRKTVLA